MNRIQAWQFFSCTLKFQNIGYLYWNQTKQSSVNHKYLRKCNLLTQSWSFSGEKNLSFLLGTQNFLHPTWDWIPNWELSKIFFSKNYKQIYLNSTWVNFLLTFWYSRFKACIGLQSIIFKGDVNPKFVSDYKRNVPRG